MKYSVSETEDMQTGMCEILKLYLTSSVTYVGEILMKGFRNITYSHIIKFKKLNSISLIAFA